MEDEADKSMHRYKTIIIGAGIAGLSAARHLVKNSVTNFLILEAKNKIGGRISAAQLGNYKVELGANWIHGVLGNPMYEIASSHGLISVMHKSKTHKVVAATEDGKQVPFEVLQEIYGAYMCFLHRCEEYFLCQYVPPDDINSVGEHINLEIALYLDRITDMREKHLRRLIFQCLLKRETCISGCDSMEEIDLFELGSYTELQGGNIVLPSGYSSIVNPVAEGIPKKAFRLNHKVDKIRYPQTFDPRLSTESLHSGDSAKTVLSLKTRDVSVSDKREYEEEFVTVSCENGTKFVADSLICTLPLGVLKGKMNAMFDPPLPEYKRESVERLLFGTVDKIYLSYDRPFLNSDISEILLLWEEDDESKSDLSKCWFKKIYSFSKVTDTLLLGWISGREAIYMETLMDDCIATVCTDVLRKFLNDPFVPKPKRILCSRWNSDDCTKGSYSAIAVGATQADIECVAQPIFADPNNTKPLILFAGEHTHSNFYSTVHGAYLTGRTASHLVVTSDSHQETVRHKGNDLDLSSWVKTLSVK